MRLTLRTLLAYLDDILDPADARELAQKIEESEFASGLVHRIRSVTRKLRLGAPRLSGKGMGLDANTVAEYLDNTLPQERSPDFEKVCLESDVQLAEVAACHQILTLVLGGPADVDPALRERIRHLLSEWDGTALPADFPRGKPVDEEDEADAEAPPVQTRRSGRRTEIVSLLDDDAPAPKSRAGQRVSWIPIAATLVVAFLLACAALALLGPLDHTHPLLGSFFAKPVQTAQVNSAQEPETIDEPAQPATPTAPAPAAPLTNDTKEATRSADNGAADGTEPKTAVSTEPPPTPAASLPEVPTEPAPNGDDPPEASMDAGPVTALNDPRLDRAKLPADSGAPKEAAAPAPLAVYTSEQHVLASWDVASESWIRLATNDPLAADQRLVALPSFRPQVLFSSGIQVVLIGPASVELVAPDSSGVPGIRPRSGRLVIMSVGEPGNRLNIFVGERASQVKFADLDATLALDVRRFLPVGTDPTSRPAHWVCEAMASAGAVMWQDAGSAAALALSSAETAVFVDQLPPVSQAVASPLPWLDPSTEARIVVSASKKLEPLLEPHRPVTVSLHEQASNRLFEIRTLAARSLGLFDEFEPCVVGLNERELRSYWKDLVDVLRAQMLTSPESAEKIRSTFDRVRGKDGAQLDRMLWGFSPEQLAEGGAHLLVAALESASTDMRVLAYLNLYEITGKTNLYAPDRDAKSQRRSLQSWQRDLDQGEIVYRVLPTGPPGTTPPTSTGEAPTRAKDVP